MTVQVQLKDRQGNSLAQLCHIRIGVYDDDGGGDPDLSDFAADATIAVGTAGDLARSYTAGKDLLCLTNASGALDIVVTDAQTEHVHLVAKADWRSPILDCQDTGDVSMNP